MQKQRNSLCAVYICALAHKLYANAISYAVTVRSLFTLLSYTYTYNSKKNTCNYN